MARFAWFITDGKIGKKLADGLLLSPELISRALGKEDLSKSEQEKIQIHLDSLGLRNGIHYKFGGLYQ